MHNLACFQLPGPGFRRRLSLISRVRELARVPRTTAEFTAGLRMGELLPMIHTLAPWLESSISVGAQIRAT
jgi:hypothetical protein